MRRLALLFAAACTSTPELSLDIRLPTDSSFLSSLSQLNLAATRDTQVLAQSSFAPSVDYVSLSGVSHGARTVITLEGVDSSGDVLARGRTCPVDFESAGQRAPLYFAPTNSFGKANSPSVARQRATTIALDSGEVLLAGGSDGTNVLQTSELFTPGSGIFKSAANLQTARWRAEAVALSSIGVLLVGGAADDGAAIAGGELYSQGRFTTVTLPDARVGHRLSLLPDGRAFVSGGSASLGGTPLSTTLFIYVLSDGSYQVTQGPQLVEARRDHAATVAIGVPVLFGGTGANGVLDSIEAVDPDGASAVIAHLQHARADATATTLANGSILLVGGVGDNGQPRADAELFNPILGTTTLYPMAAARSGHSATLLDDGRVLVAGGLDGSQNALNSVELFDADAGFLSERSLETARAYHAAVPLCDNTVLVVGGSADAELYTEPAN